MAKELSEVSCKYGAPMGRAERGSDPGEEKWTLQRVRLDSGGYDTGGAYWGIGEPLYWASAGDVDRYVRASDREIAKTRIRKEFPEAFFVKSKRSKRLDIKIEPARKAAVQRVARRLNVSITVLMDTWIDIIAAIDKSTAVDKVAEL